MAWPEGGEVERGSILVIVMLMRLMMMMMMMISRGAEAPAGRRHRRFAALTPVPELKAWPKGSIIGTVLPLVCLSDIF